MKNILTILFRRKFTFVLIILLLGSCHIVNHTLPRMIIAPERRDTGATLPSDLRSRTFDIDSSLGIRAWESRPKSPPTLAIVVLHGIGDSKKSQQESLRTLSSLGYLAIAPDLRAHGDSGGHFATYGFYEKSDLSKILTQLQKKIPTPPIGLWGTSYGGAVSLQALGNDKRFSFGIIESTFASLPEVVDQYAKNITGMDLSMLTRHSLHQAGKMASFDPYQVIPENSTSSITCPLLHMHGTIDKNIPISHAYRIGQHAKNCPYRFVEFPQGGHFNLASSDPQKHWTEVTQFLQSIVTAHSSGKR